MTTVAGVERPVARLGTIGHLAIFAATLAAVMLAPAARLPWAAAACLLVAWLITPRALRTHADTSAVMARFMRAIHDLRRAKRLRVGS